MSQKSFWVVSKRSEKCSKHIASLKSIRLPCSKDFNDKLVEAFKGLRKKHFEEYVEVFDNIRILSLPDLMKTQEIKDATKSKETSKIECCCRFLEKEASRARK